MANLHGMFQLTSLAQGSGSAQFTYSATQNNGKITSQTDLVSGEQVVYTYDALNRLASAQTTANPNVTQWGQSYNYDGAPAPPRLRTRDKMSAARRKGKWVGGCPVLGYDVDPAGGRLVNILPMARGANLIAHGFAMRRATWQP